MRFYTQHDPTKVSNLIMHIGEICDYINTHFDGYHKHSGFRQKIAAKKEELRKILNSVASPFPAYGLPMPWNHPEKRDEMMNHYIVEY